MDACDHPQVAKRPSQLWSERKVLELVKDLEGLESLHCVGALTDDTNSRSSRFLMLFTAMGNIDMNCDETNHSLSL